MNRRVRLTAGLATTAHQCARRKSTQAGRQLDREWTKCLQAIVAGNQYSNGERQGRQVLSELRILVGSDEEFLVAANWRGSPFLRPDHPASATVTTSCAANTDRRRRGSDSSSRMRMWRYGLARLLQNRDGCLAANGRKFIEKLVERLAGLKIVE